jgi:putative Ca2+/H+ antiporter (TMEM165/GDT1 family)
MKVFFISILLLIQCIGLIGLGIVSVRQSVLVKSSLLATLGQQDARAPLAVKSQFYLEDKDQRPLAMIRRRIRSQSGSIAVAAALLLLLGLPAASHASAGIVPTTGTIDAVFLQSFLLIFISEIGDKTFFIAALLAAKYGRLISFTGSMGALIAMTVISTSLGQIFHAVPSFLAQGIPFDDYLAVIAFAYFGIKTLLDASKLQSEDSLGIEEEKAEAEELVNEVSAKQKRQSVASLILQTFSLVFAAEIGDRSFLSTIALSAALNPYAVSAGAIAAHGSATGVAVLGGALMSKYLSEKVIGYIGGSLFLVFAVTTALGLF